mmetsp:Transcript_9192/g.25702  ORF Transcript_9192/g.25702 Transcript_9192/m.25702 type:complete len:277 (-) Transcript_9192:1606-2436(-)
MAQQEPVRAAEALVALERAHEALEVAKGAALDVARGGKEVLRGLELALAPLLPQARHPVRRGPEEEEVLLAHALPDLHVGTVQRANEQAAVHLELHVAGARGLQASRRDVLTELSGRDELLGRGDIVVGHEVQAHDVVDVGVVVDDPADGIGQSNALLRRPVRVEGLPADDADAFHLLRTLRGSHGLVLVVAVHDAEDVHQLPLVLMHTLDLDVEEPIGSIANRRSLALLVDACPEHIQELALACRLHGCELLLQLWVAGLLQEALEQRGLLDPGI